MTASCRPPAPAPKPSRAIWKKATSTACWSRRSPSPRRRSDRGRRRDALVPAGLHGGRLWPPPRLPHRERAAAAWGRRCRPARPARHRSGAAGL
ncbi:MAG: hypothetical protein E2577_08375 [Starkeya sp.]|nr:hypothetical protein [Starkeya sp.]